MKFTQNDAISISKLTEKQLLSIPLFRTVKNVNGDHAFRELIAKIQVIQYNSQMILKNLSKNQYFVFVLEGKIAISKRSKQQQKVIKSVVAGQYWGHQDLFLNINQVLQIKSISKCELMLIPLDILHKCFRRVICLTNLRSKTEFLKNFPPFRSQQIQKLLKLAAYCEKRSVPRNYILCSKGTKIQNIFIMIEGKLQKQQFDSQKSIEVKKNTLIGYDEIKSGQKYYHQTIKSIHSCEVILIPIDQLQKAIQIKNKLNQTNFYRYQDSPQPSRPNTSLFSQQAISTNPTKSLNSRRYKTEMFSTSVNIHNKTEQPEKLTISDIYLLKFIKRKEKKEKKQVMKFIKSRAPQVVIDLNKQYSLVKPLHISRSQYVKSYKWKLKKSIKISQRNSCSVHSFASQSHVDK